MRYFSKRTWIIFLLASILGSCRTDSEPASPNLVIVFPDQWRGQALGFLGEEPVHTPRLDRFATEGIVFTQAVSNYPLCSPFRGMFMTGNHPHTTGVTSNCNSLSAPYGCQLRQNDRTWSDILHEVGYSLGYIGKWHLDSPYGPYIDCSNNRGEVAWNEWCPPERRHGFDFWYAYGTYDRHTRPMYWTGDAPRDGFHYVDQWGPEHEADLAIEYIRNRDGRMRDPGKPFALVVSMNPPHMPYDLVPEKYLEIYRDADLEELCKRPNIPPAGSKWGDYYRKNIRGYYAHISGVDEQFGRILDALEQEGLDEETIVLFTSDHGNCLGIHDQISKNNHYEESMRVPFLLRWTGKLGPGRTDLLISTPDIYPTLFGLMGLQDLVPPEVEGTSHASLLLTGEGRQPSSQVYFGIPVDRPEWGRRGVRTARYTLVINKIPDEPDEVVLHDNIDDPYQLWNIAAENPDTVRELIEQELIPWLRRLHDPWIRHVE